MEPEPYAIKSLRHKCPACYKQYKLKEHLVEHMKESWHSVHQPKCGVCRKHCKTLESVREHLTGPLAKSNCKTVFSALGCNLCLSIFDTTDALRLHEVSCNLAPPLPELMPFPISEMCDEAETTILSSPMSNGNGASPKLVGMDCEMVGGGSDGTLDICARVCLVDELEEVIFHSYAKTIIPVTNYRYEITGITEGHLVDALPLSEVREKVTEILRNGETSTWKMRTDGGKACLLIGHDLEHDLECLQMEYPDNLIRDTAKYPPLLKTNLIKHSLKYLTRTYLGYEIQSGVHNPYEDAVAAMRLYKRICSLAHENGGVHIEDGDGSIRHMKKKKKKSPFDSYKKGELLDKSPDELLEISRSAYKCWCMDSRKVVNS